MGYLWDLCDLQYPGPTANSHVNWRSLNWEWDVLKGEAGVANCLCGSDPPNSAPRGMWISGGDIGRAPETGWELNFTPWVEVLVLPVRCN